MRDPRTPRQIDDALFEAAKLERSSWDAHWTELGELFHPRSSRFLISDVNDGRKRHNKVYDSTMLRAPRIGAAGLMAGGTSPARPWMRIRPADPDLWTFQPARVWCEDVGQRILRVFAKSNTYRAFARIYLDLFVYGTGASVMLPHYQNVVHHHLSAMGEYYLTTNYEGRVNGMLREFQKTVAEVAEEFGLDAMQPSTRRLWETHAYGERITIRHLITRRTDRDPQFADARNMPWRSVYYEAGAADRYTLRESGFERFPVMAPRWEVVPGNIYGDSPCMMGLGDAKQLNQEQLRKGQVIDLMTKPPLRVPTKLKGKLVSLLPGGKTPADGKDAIGPIYQPTLQLDHLLMDINDVRQRLNESCHVDMFLMMHLGRDTPQKTATEVAELHAEKLLILGPTLENLQNEMQRPAVMEAFALLSEAGALPPPPPDLEGVPLDIEFIGMLAQAQKQAGIGGIDRFVGSMMALAQGGKGQVLDLLDEDKWAFEMADGLGVPPALLREEREVAKIRAARAEQMQAQAQAAAAQQLGAATRDFAAAGATQLPEAQFSSLVS